MVKNKTINVLSLTVLFLVFAVNFSSAAFSGSGLGTYDNPYQVTNCTQLDEIRNDLDANYSLLYGDINFSTSECSDYIAGDGWVPLGNVTDPFVGTFFGNGYKIINLYINRPSENNISLFGHTSGGSGIYATIYNLGLENVSIIGNGSVGGLIGYGWEAVINNSYVRGNVSGQNNIGGLIGNGNYVTINNSYSVVNVTSIGSYIGGLVGDGSYLYYIFNSSSAGIINGGDSSTGGLAGSCTGGKILESYSTAKVTGAYTVGGLVGSGQGVIISYSYATGDVTATESTAGGILGYGKQAIIGHSYASGNVSGFDWVGGLVGDGDVGINISSSYATGNVVCEDFWWSFENMGVGGLVGAAINANITYVYATGNVTSQVSSSNSSGVGGLIGHANGSIISNAYSVGNVTGAGDYVGGLVGINGSASILGCYWDINVSGQITSSGGAGLTTIEMKDYSTFNIWNIGLTTFGETNLSMIWNIINTSTYPFLSWEDARVLPDLVAPVISAISASTPSTSSTTITWTTNESANSTVNYGISENNLNESKPNSSLSTSHSIWLVDLIPNTLYYYNVTSCDSSGNCNTSGPNSFTTDAVSDGGSGDGGSGGGSSGGGGGGGGGGPSIVSRWVKEIKVNGSELNLGQTLKGLKEKYRITFNVSGMGHSLGILNISSSNITVEVASTPQIATLQVGETKKFDVTEDNSYDLSVSLIGIFNGTANVSIKSINESYVPVFPSVSSNGAVTNNAPSAAPSVTDTNNILDNKNLTTNLIIAVVAIIILAVLSWVFYFRNVFRQKKVEKSIRYADKN